MPAACAPCPPRRFPSDLTDAQWRLLAPLLPAPRSGPGRPGRPATSRRALVNAILYVLWTGCPWRALPDGYPHWRTVHHHFAHWAADGTLARLHAVLRGRVRAAAGRTVAPTAAVIDAQSVRAGDWVSRATKGYDAAKKVHGRKRHCLGDPIPGVFGSSSEHERWLGTRWLELAKHNGGLGGWLASVVSKERPERQFIAESLINPQRPYNDVPPATDCPGSYPAPGRAELAPADQATADEGLAILSAKAPHARNMGFAVWQPPGQSFVDLDAYVQVYNPEGNPAQNPGSTGEDGEKKVVWRFGDQQIANLQPQPRGTAAPVVGRVVVLAIPCLSENVPADLGTAAMATYAVSSDGTLMPVSDPGLLASQALHKERLSRVACQVPA